MDLPSGDRLGRDHRNRSGNALERVRLFRGRGNDHLTHLISLYRIILYRNNLVPPHLATAHQTQGQHAKTNSSHQSKRLFYFRREGTRNSRIFQSLDVVIYRPGKDSTCLDLVTRDNPVHNGIKGQTRDGLDPQFGRNVLSMRQNRIQADIQPVRDLLIGYSLYDLS